MNLRDPLIAAWRWLMGPRGIMLFAVSLLFVLMSASFVNIPWNLPAAKCGGSLCDIPVTQGPPGNPGITDAMFGGYVILVILSAIVLAACMVGGVYLAKTEEGP